MSRFAQFGPKFRQYGASSARMFLYCAVPTACFIHTVFDYAGEITPSFGPSMLPTLNMAGDMLMIERLPGWRKRLQVGDLVAFTTPYDPARRAVKRLLAEAGDTVCVDPKSKHPSFVLVPKGHVWLQGDNFNNSTDSRVYGPIPLGLLHGRVTWCVWPSPRRISNGAEILPGHFSDS
ncbi:hypothetical protein GGI24_000408 [Coemansia furcata]|nr:hypothetical protein GGI24_000408 [Coemansia furcata]